MISSQIERQTVAVVLDAITEAIIVGLPAYFVWRVNMKPYEKFKVISIFGFRIFNVAFMAGLVASYHPFVDRPGSQYSEAAAIGIWSQVVLGYSLISASIPCIRSFLMAFLADGVYRVYDATSGSEAKSHLPAFDSYQSKPQSSNTAGLTSVVDPTVHRPLSDEEIASIPSDASRRMMIERRVDFIVESEEAVK